MTSRWSRNSSTVQRVRALSPVSQRTLEMTQFARDLSKRSANKYLSETVRFPQSALQWTDVASVQLSGQLDRVLSKVTHYYGPDGERYGPKRKKVADLMVGLEISKLFDLVSLSPHVEETLKPRSRSIQTNFRLPEVRKFRFPVKRSELS